MQTLVPSNGTENVYLQPKKIQYWAESWQKVTKCQLTKQHSLRYNASYVGKFFLIDLTEKGFENVDIFKHER